MKIPKILLVVSLFSSILFSQSYKILNSTSEKILIEIDFSNAYSIADTILQGKKYNKIEGKQSFYRNIGEPWLPNFFLDIGIPTNANPELRIVSKDVLNNSNKFIIPFPKEDPSLSEKILEFLDEDIYSSNKFFPSEPVNIDEKYNVRFARVMQVGIAPYQFNPVTRELLFNRKLVIEIAFNALNSSNIIPINDAVSYQFISDNTINADQAKNWISKRIEFESPSSGEYWYNPSHNYFKIYIKKKGVYRVTFLELLNKGVQISGGISNTQLALYMDGEQIPLDIFDSNDDDIFNEDDYFQFIGYPPSASPNVASNIYTNSNVYWFTYQNDSDPKRFNRVDGYPETLLSALNIHLSTIHSEKDFIYERLGYAPDGNRDYWFWGKAASNNNQPTIEFLDYFPILPKMSVDSARVNLRVNLTGMNSILTCPLDNEASIFLTGQSIGKIEWKGQNNVTFNKDIYISPDSIKMFPEGNRLEVWNYGNPCQNQNSGDIRINWYEFEYWKSNSADSNHFFFNNSPNLLGPRTHWIFNWKRDNMKIYVPQQNKIIINPRFHNDAFNSVFVRDTSAQYSEYFAVSDDYYSTVDSIIADESSDIRNNSVGADYIIITHPKFLPVAERLKNLREQNFPDESIENARIQIINVIDIYDEFSYGLLDPFSLRKFISHAFDAWTAPAPAYVVLLGDMSYDYREILSDSRENYIPSLPYHSPSYGQAVSDNMIVSIVGEDFKPEMAIGRLSCETVAEGNILLDKLEAYPDDQSKQWLQNVLLVASGVDASDEARFRFNDESMKLENTYIKPKGIATSKVFHFPNRPEYIPFQGEGPQIRKAINDGAVLLNYYGHAGGYQWDLVFLNDDIYLLENAGKLPVILSGTCYTAHFDNQDVFGEQFQKVPNKGSIGFLGASALAFWGPAKDVNEKIFSEIFENENFVIGKAIQFAKGRLSNSALNPAHQNIINYLGDPVLKLAIPRKPDFNIKSSGITISPNNPLINDSTEVKVILNNLGWIFPDDTVSIQLHAASQDTSYLIGTKKISSFGEIDSTFFAWYPNVAGLYELRAEINLIDQIPEVDPSDNFATASFPVFNISEPNIIKPIDAYSFITNNIDFVFSDIGTFIDKSLKYYIEIDTVSEFSNPIYKSELIEPTNGIVKWNKTVEGSDYFYWRSRIWDGNEFGKWSTTRSFSIKNEENSYLFEGDLLKSMELYNINFNESNNSLQLNTELLPPKPEDKRFVEFISLQDPVLDSVNLTTITTDGKYIYFANMWYFSLLAGNPSGKSYIYKMGTGNEGTVKGQFYGALPNSYFRFANQIFYHSDGFIYAASGNPYYLNRFDPDLGFIDSVFIPSGLLDWNTSKSIEGSFYLASDGNYIYNLTLVDSMGNNKYVLRILDPSNNWNKIDVDKELTGASYQGFSGFFVADGYIYPTEYLNNNYMRRIRISDGFFEEEWFVSKTFRSYYSWTYDWANDELYTSVYRPSGFAPRFAKFRGRYADAIGTANSNIIGPALDWYNLKYNIESSNRSGNFRVFLLGQNKNTKSWDTISTNVSENFSLENINAENYPYLRYNVLLSDSSFGNVNPIEIKSFIINYRSLPEILLEKSSFAFSEDTLLQGFNTEMELSILNIGNSAVDSVLINFYLNEDDSIFHSEIIRDIAPDTMKTISKIIETIQMPPATIHSLQAIATSFSPEFYTYNNITNKSFFVARDSIKPEFSITFDDKEILDGDIVSAKPKIKITLKDNSPLPLDTSYFTLIYTYDKQTIPLSFSREDLQYTYTPYPNSESLINWEPLLNDGRHSLEVLAKDASGNFFDTTSYRTVFYVYNEADLKNVVNYPNPFTDDTHFTFELRGTKVPEELMIKIYTVAGRLIRDIEIPSSELNIGFNTFYWNGRDQDGDEIANGLYFYKLISSHDGEIKTATEKVVKVK